ncbi:MAG TPA: photosynthetic reaction center cytochrome c subunit family protein, partial [Candidatus Sulfotelmatobacter sp.]|nr:photosynthetic reaction center cytochrome c subunit family protein [Candidatus Sulfotelmatobacter sp.]
MKRTLGITFFVFLFTFEFFATRNSGAQNPVPSATAETQKTAEQVFKNIQTLKGVPSDQLQPAMQFISNSLGVECEFCHVQGAFEKDEK